MGCTGHGPGASANRDARPLEVLLANDPETLDPRYATDAVGLRTTRLIHAGLVRLDPDTLEPRPYVARTLTWIDDFTLHVELRDDARFHSGAPLRPEDVVATLRAFGSPEVASRHARVVEAIGSAEIDLPILRADEAAAPPRADGTLDGLGPFVVALRAPGAIELAPAPRSQGSARVVLRTVHDENARALRFHAGRADVVVNGFSPTLLPALTQAKGVNVTARPGANLTYLLARTDRGPLGDPRVRRALSLGIDRATIVRALLAGRGQPAGTLLPPTLWAHVPREPLPYDPTAARRLLDEAGARGLRLSLLTSTERSRRTLALTMAQNLAEIGVELEVISLELGAMIARLSNGDFELASLQIPEITEPNVLRVFLHSASIPPAGANRARIQDADVDRLLDESDALRDPAARRAVFARLEDVVRERALLVPLWHEDQVAVTSERAAPFRPSAEGRWLDLASLR